MTSTPESRNFEAMFHCTHVEYPCCGCGPELLTPEEVAEREEAEALNEDFDCLGYPHSAAEPDAEPDCDGPDLHDLAFEDRLCGEAY